MIVGRGGDSVTEELTQNIIITRFCSSLCYCSEHIISGGRLGTEKNLWRLRQTTFKLCSEHRQVYY